MVLEAYFSLQGGLHSSAFRQKTTSNSSLTPHTVMSRRYDSRTTIFSPEGRLYQVEYAMEAIGHAGACLGLLAKDGVVLAAEKRVTGKLLDQRDRPEKTYQLAGHVACAVAGITADANILVEEARMSAQRYEYTYQEPIPVEELVTLICSEKHVYTQYGGLRPFGVSFLYAGWDRRYGFQLYHSDPSGNYAGWKATAIGANNNSAMSILKQEHDSGAVLGDALKLAVKVMSKSMDSTALTHDKLEFSTLTVEEGTGRVVFHLMTPTEVDVLLADYKKSAEDADKDKDKEKK